VVLCGGRGRGREGETLVIGGVRYVRVCVLALIHASPGTLAWPGGVPCRRRGPCLSNTNGCPRGHGIELLWSPGGGLVGRHRPTQAALCMCVLVSLLQDTKSESQAILQPAKPSSWWVCAVPLEKGWKQGVGGWEGERQMPCLGLLGCEEPLGRGEAKSPREHLSPPRSNRGAQ